MEFTTAQDNLAAVYAVRHGSDDTHCASYLTTPSSFWQQTLHTVLLFVFIFKGCMLFTTSSFMQHDEAKIHQFSLIKTKFTINLVVR